MRQQAFNAARARDLLFGGGGIDKVVGPGSRGKSSEGFEQAYQSSAPVVGTQTVETVALESGLERVVLPARGRPHGVEMGVEQHGGAVFTIMGSDAPHVVA